MLRSKYRKKTQEIKSNRSSKYCHISADYNWNHIKLSGYNCNLKHRSYQWPAKIANNNTLISDSICKYSRSLNDTFVQAYPGANINSITFKIRIGRIKVTEYSIIILHVGTNDLWKRNPSIVINDMKLLIETIRTRNPTAVIVLSQLINRPCDEVETDQYRKTVNRGYQNLAKELKSGCNTWKTWRSTENRDRTTDRSLFSRDLLHLNYKGNLRLKQYIESNLVTLKGILQKVPK